MKILVINCGSSSIKYRLFDVMENGELLDTARGLLSNLNQENAAIVQDTDKGRYQKQLDRPDYRQGFEAMMAALLDGEKGVLKDISEISAVGHRAVHGGETFYKPVMVDETVKAKMRECIPLAPLHNPANLSGIEQMEKMLPGIPQSAVFDTAFHQTLPEAAYMYPLPYDLYEKHRIRKYGFHGTSCDYVSQQAAKLLGAKREDLKMVVCHLGNGVTVNAVKNGKSVDTSLGLTTVAGVMMGTRSGELDPGVVLFLENELGMDPKAVEKKLNKESGMLGISGLSNDLRDIEDAAEKGHKRCQLALDMFCYRIRRYIGAYAFAMGGVDAVVFTGGIGENSDVVRGGTITDLEFMSIELDREKNKIRSKEDRIISTENSKVKICVVATNEELMIARETLGLLK